MDVNEPQEPDPGLGEDKKSPQERDRISLIGPFLHVAACSEKSGRDPGNPWCLLFITGSAIIVMPVPSARLKTDPSGNRPGEAPAPAPSFPGKWFSRGRDPDLPGRLDHLVMQYRHACSGSVVVMEPGSDTMPLDRIQEITLTWERSHGRYFRMLFPFGQYPAEPENAGYRVNFLLTVTTADKNIVLVTPFSPDLRQALRCLAGDRVREIPDDYAPLL